MRLWTLLAALAASAMVCAPAAAQKISDMPAATTLAGTEKVAGIQGSGCATHTTPCANVAITAAQIATYVNASVDPQLAAIAALSPSADQCTVWTGSSAAAVYNCTSFMRGLAGSANAAAARSTLAAAGSGANGDITSLTGLTTALPLTEGGTGATSAGAARTALGVTATGSDTTYAYRANNLSDLPSAETARSNLSMLTLVHPGYVAGRWYWEFTVVQVNNPIAIGAATLRLAPMFVPQRVTISDLFTRIGTASAGGNIQIGIYAMDTSTRLATGNVLTSTGNISTTTATVVSATLASNYQLAPGWYWVGVMADNGTATVEASAGGIVRAAAMIGSTTLGNVSSGSSTNSIAYQYSVTFGTWPNLTSVTPTEVLTGEVMIGFKVASVP